LLAPSAYAAVEASVDRDVVEQNESFLLEVVVDGNTSQEPDVSPLDEDFIVGQSSQMSNTKIINGQISRSMTWTYTLMAKEAGEFTIPPIPVGSEESRPITIKVLEPKQEPPGEADVFVTAEVDADTTWVQAQVLYKIKVYRAVATRQPTLREPVITGAEALVEVASEESTYDAILGGRSYNVVERSIAIFPQESGEISISPARFEARVIVNGRITGRKVFESEPQTISVKPIPAAPDDYPDAAWLPARDLDLSEEWSREPRRLAAGEPVSRTITVGVLGQLETQIPALEIPEPDGISLYPDQPELSRRFESGGIRGVRKDEYAMIAVGNGETSLPAVELPWFDTEEESWKVATLPERRLTIVGAAPTEPVAPEPVAGSSDADSETESTPPPMPAVTSPFWQQVAGGLFLLWLLTLGAWWWSLRPRRPAVPQESKPVPPHKLQSRCLKQARKAALAGDAPALKDAMLEWGKLQWPQTPPRSLGTLAGKLSSPLSEQLMAVSRSSYGPDAPHWDGEAIARSLRSFAVLDQNNAVSEGDALPPLMPT
jgi:hypothetical protein